MGLITARKLLSSRGAGLACVAVSYLYLISLPGQSKSALLWLTNFLIIALSCGLVYFDSRNAISLKKVSGIFVLLFFGIAPILEYKMKIQYWGGGEISDNDYIFVNILILIAMTLYFVVYRISFSIQRSNYLRAGDQALLNAANSRLRFLRLLPPVVVSLLVILWFNDFNFLNLLLRGGDLRGDSVLENKTVGLIVNNFLRPFCFSALILCVFVARQYFRSNIIWCLVFGPIALLACFPTAIARFAIAALYIPLILVLYPGILKRGFLAVNGLVVSFVTIFPFFDAFRNFGQKSSVEYFAFGFDFFAAGHFDAYQNFVRTVSLDIVTGGNQLLGALLFFIPRTMWSQKPLGSGELLASKANLALTNIAQSLPAEGYINFGVFGIFAFVAFAAYCSAAIDRRFWREEMALRSSTFSLHYFQLIGLAIFIWRGDLLNAIAYTSGFLFSMALACHIYKSKPIRLYRAANR